MRARAGPALVALVLVDLQYRRHILCKPESASPRTPLEPDDQPLQFIARGPPRHLVDVAYPRPQTPAATDRGEDKRGRSGSRTWPPCSPPATGRGSAGAEVESEKGAAERGRVDSVIAGLLFMAGMRRSEVSALRWADIVDATDGDGMLVTVRRSKTNPEGDVNVGGRRR